MMDAGDREASAALKAAQCWLTGKPPVVWLWMIRQQEAQHDEYGVLAWMKTQPEYVALLQEGLPANLPVKLPEEYREYRSAETWDCFQKFGWVDCPRPGSRAFKQWLEKQPPQAKRLIPELFPETPTQKLKRIGFGIACLGMVVVIGWQYYLHFMK